MERAAKSAAFDPGCGIMAHCQMDMVATRHLRLFTYTGYGYTALRFMRVLKSSYVRTISPIAAGAIASRNKAGVRRSSEWLSSAARIENDRLNGFGTAELIYRNH